MADHSENDDLAPYVLVRFVGGMEDQPEGRVFVTARFRDVPGGCIGGGDMYEGPPSEETYDAVRRVVKDVVEAGGRGWSLEEFAAVSAAWRGFVLSQEAMGLGPQARLVVDMIESHGWDSDLVRVAVRGLPVKSEAK